MKIYIASGISDFIRKAYQIRLAHQLRELQLEVYAAAENNSINDKSKNPTPLDIYHGDVSQILDSQLFLFVISGAGEDGTKWEQGFVSGVNEERSIYNQIIDMAIESIEAGFIDDGIKLLKDVMRDPIKVIAYTTNERMLMPQFYKGDKEGITGIPSASYNHLIMGSVDRWGSFRGTEEDAFAFIQDILKEL